MDLSETYIKMCEKAKEIQGRGLQKGDIVCHSKIVGIFPFEFCYIGDVSTDVWLPRQDQLQEMIEASKFANNQSWWKIGSFYDWVKDTGRYTFDTMEQLWLAFVYHEKYHKKWEGSQWIVKDSIGY